MNNKRKYEENYYEKKNYNEMEIKSEPIQSTFWYNQTITLEQIKEYNSKINKEIPIKELKNFCMNDKENIKLVEKENPININTMLSDISLVPKGIDEEKVYLNNIEYTNIIRRGNTFMETYYKDKYDNWVLDNTFMLRKGMKKFIDIPYKFYLERTTENPYDKFWDENLDDNIKKSKYILNFELDEMNVSTLKYIFYPVLEAIQQGYLIEIIKLMKANGENAQISYSEYLDCWVIASKNVCLTAKNRNDLEKFPPQNKEGKNTRYMFSYIIGHCWFDIIDKFSSDKIKELKDYLKDKTFVGEYVGNQLHQHLIRYMKHTILFFGIVKNYEKTSSIPIYEAFKTFKNLNDVPYEFIAIVDNLDKVFETIKSLYKRIAESSIIDEEEGSVIYLNQTRARSQFSDLKYRDTDKVLSLFKLKTWEYRVYRKLREKIKNNLSNTKYYFENSRRKISQFFEELRIMLAGFNLPMPLQFYYKVAETAFEFSNYYNKKFKKGDEDTDPNKIDLHSTYIDFIETIHSIVDDTVNLKSRVISQNNVMTYDYLIKNNYKQKKVIEIFIYAPPCYLSDKFLKKISEKYKIEILNSKIENNLYFYIKDDLIVYHINMHNFRNITKIGDNQFIFIFGINGNEINKSMEEFKNKIKNPLFKTYNKNKSLIPFLNHCNDDNDIEEEFKYFKTESIVFVSNLKKNFNDKIKIFDNFEENKSDEYLNIFDVKINEIKEQIKDIDIEKIKNETFFVENLNLLEDDISNNNNENNKDVNYSNSKNKNKSKYYKNPLIDIYEEHINPFESLKEEFINHLNTLSKDKEEIKQDDENLKRVYVIIPMTIPGNGKTYFINQLKPIIEKYGIYFYSIGSDNIRRKIMDNMLRKNHYMTEKEAFDKSRFPANKEFEKQLENMFKEIYFDDKIKNAIIYIDKNHPPNAISRSIDPINKCLQDNLNSTLKLDLKFIALTPECVNYFFFSDTSFIPFSLSYFIQCYLRVKHRNDHPTLNGDQKDLIVVFAVFIKNFINVSLKENDIIMFNKLDQIIKLPFTDEIDENNLPKELVNTAKKFFVSIQNDGYERVSTPTTEYFEKLINNTFPKGNEFFPTKNFVSQTTEPIIVKLYNKIKDDSQKAYIHNFIYLGIMINNQDFTVKIKSIIYKTLKNFKSKYNINNNEIDDLIKTIQLVTQIILPKKWNYPHKYHNNLWHTTLLFKGNQPLSKVENLPQFKQFEEGKLCKINIIGIIYIPECLIVLIIKLPNDVYSVNKFPHITAFIGKYPPKFSNNVMEEILKNSELKNLYDKIMKNDNEDSIDTNLNEENYFNLNININDEDVSAYIYLTKKELIIEGNMHAFEK